MKKLFLLTFFSILVVYLSAQNVSNFWLGIAPSIQTTKETRYTSTFRSGLGYLGTMGYSHINEKRTLFIETSFASATVGASNISSSRNLQPNLQLVYLFVRPDKINFGPDLQIGSLLQFRNGTTSSNNRISYLIWNSLGVSASKAITIGNTPVMLSASAPLLSYVIRPSYSFPFTDRFLLQENFNFDLENLRSNIIRGGKLRTINSFIHLKLGLGISPFRYKKLGMSLRYQFEYLSYLQQKSLFQFTHQLIFTFMLSNKK